ncbi:membrane protein [Pilimelia anulata]|uniref:Membrane protein n=1 Tax=Pilimelia anulata TaxID=53371 RepID=A0A8J3B3R2_9ACTN|nr:low temperature requirement protein A [Pilimelia anulata]GGJ85764.1 membrane protein [Pilimelia anulata]
MSAARTMAHRLGRMAGRDPHEPGRTATPLELLYDLTFVVAFGLAADKLAHAVAEAHVVAGLVGFAFATFAICWAWINFSWFSSAFDNDDWGFRLATMAQMVGVVVMALGLPQMFDSIGGEDHLDLRTMVLGYVIMRVSMLTLWLRAGRHDPAHRRACRTYAAALSVAQVGWVVLALVRLRPVPALLLALGLFLLELAGPVLAERYRGGTPWHAHHIAERYGLLAIITLGEGVIGTVATLSAVVETYGWSGDALAVVVAGIGLTFGMWWTYYLLPSAPALHAHRQRAFVWGYGHMIIFGAIAATGGGMHVAAYGISGESHLGPGGTALAIALPVGVFAVAIHGLHAYLVRTAGAGHVLLLAGTAAVLVGAVLLAVAHVPLAICLVVLMLAPMVPVVGSELLGRRDPAPARDRLAGADD